LRVIDSSTPAGITSPRSASTLWSTASTTAMALVPLRLATAMVTASRGSASVTPEAAPWPKVT